jgi:hypothetical protein
MGTSPKKTEQAIILRSFLPAPSGPFSILFISSPLSYTYCFLYRKLIQKLKAFWSGIFQKSLGWHRFTLGLPLLAWNRVADLKAKDRLDLKMVKS